MQFLHYFKVRRRAASVNRSFQHKSGCMYSEYAFFLYSQVNARTTTTAIRCSITWYDSFAPMFHTPRTMDDAALLVAWSVQNLWYYLLPAAWSNAGAWCVACCLVQCQLRGWFANRQEQLPDASAACPSSTIALWRLAWCASSLVHHGRAVATSFRSTSR